MRPTAVLLISFLGATAPLPAQDPGAGLMSADEEMVLKLFHTRPSSDAQVELDLVRSRLKAAETEAAELGGMEKIAGARVGVKKGEIDLLEDRLKLAKKEKNAARADELTAQVRREKAQLAVFKRIEDAAEAHADWVKALREVVEELEEVNEIELGLGKAREAHRTAADVGTSADLDKLEAEVSSSLKRHAKALKRYASAASDAAKRLDKLVDTRLELLDTWEKVKAGKGRW